MDDFEDHPTDRECGALARILQRKFQGKRAGQGRDSGDHRENQEHGLGESSLDNVSMTACNRESTGLVLWIRLELYMGK